LIRIYLHTFQVTGDEFYRRIAIDTLEYIRREMVHESGGFFSTQDADSEGEEGKFFVWSPEDVSSVLSEEDAKTFCFLFDISDNGNFEGKNILNAKYSIARAAEALKKGEDQLNQILERGRTRLFEARESRVKPFRDEKILTAWNGLMLSAFAEAAGILGNKDYLAVAKTNANFILDKLQQDGRLLRTWKDGRCKLNAYIEDYANVADGLLQLYQVSGEVDYLKESLRFADVMVTEFWDEDNGGFYFTGSDHEELIVRNKDFYDNATPSGNSVAADLFLRLSMFTADAKYERFATTVLRLIGSQIRRYPQGFGRALSALEFYLAKKKEVVIIGPPDNDLDRVIKSKYLPNSICIPTDEPASDCEWVPMLHGKEMIGGRATAYVCEEFVCQRPVTTAGDLLQEIHRA
jgi:hypothetical protein